MDHLNVISDNLYMSSFKNDFGWLRAISDGENIVRLDWNQIGWRATDRPDHVSRETEAQLSAFFCRKLYKFTLPLAPTGTTRTGRYWLDNLAKIPYGSVMSYTKFAEFAGKPGAARAAGSSCANNPIPIIYPCHRVIRKNNTLGNYSAGSRLHPAHRENLRRKASLLALESQQTAHNI